MLKHKFLFAILTVCVFGGTCAYANSDMQIQVKDHPLYIGVEGGYAASLDVGLNVNESPNASSGSVWDHPTNGWSDKIGSVWEYGALIGYNISNLVSLELTYNDRPNFRYSKYQIVPTSTAIGNRTRYFDLENTTLMLNGVFHLTAISDTLQSWKQKAHLEPFVNLGFGLSKNHLSNFYGVSNNNGSVFSKMTDKNFYTLGLQAGCGLDFFLSDNWSLKAGYRFVYAGKFNTQDYVLDDPDNLHPAIPGSGTTANPWNGKLKTNEVYLNVDYRI